MYGWFFFLRERRFDRWRIDDSIRISLSDREDSSGAAGGRLIGNDTHLFVLSSQTHSGAALRVSGGVWYCRLQAS
jgi:hypothetical protein